MNLFLDMPVPLTEHTSKSIYRRVYRSLQHRHQSLVKLGDDLQAAAQALQTDPDRTCLAFFSEVQVHILQATFGAFLTYAGTVKDVIYDRLHQNLLTPFVSRLGTALLEIISGFTQLEYFVSVQIFERNDEDTSDAPIPSPSPPSSAEDQLDSLLVLCRICEQYVRLPLIEEHSLNCVRAYETGYAIVSTDDRIQKLMVAITGSLLDHPWPGDEFRAVSRDLPLLHAVLVLKKVLQPDKDLGSCREALATISMNTDDPNANEMLARARLLAQEKRDQSGRLSAAISAQIRTTVSSTGDAPALHVTRLCDFVFVKRISSGAYARVFLARKENTGDIYAIKVTAKSGVTQKNELKRIIAEKDILLQFSNAFIVNFCMLCF
jgi:hypothetical protein